MLSVAACGRLGFDELERADTVPADGCAPLPPARGPLVGLEPGDDLRAAVAAAEPGTTFVLGDTYAVRDPIVVSAANVTIRSRSGDPSRTILDAGFEAKELIVGTVADGTTLAEITILRASSDAIKVGTDSVPARGAALYRLELRDAGAAMVRIGRDSDDGLVACSRLEQTDAGRAVTANESGNCSSGGVIATANRGWKVRDNEISGLTCDSGLSLPAIGFTLGSGSTRTTNNLIVDCSRGIAYGNGNDAGHGHDGGAILNNVVWATVAVDTGISLEQAADTRVYHNTVLARPGVALFTSIDHRFPQTTADIRNNLVERITVRDGSLATLGANLEATDLSYVTDPEGLDFHLTAVAIDAIDAGEVVDDAGRDIDGEPHTNGPPDIGADER